MAKHAADRDTRREITARYRARSRPFRDLNGNGRAVRLEAMLDRKAGARVRRLALLKGGGNDALA
jgi:hypothetical protein